MSFFYIVDRPEKRYCLLCNFTVLMFKQRFQTRILIHREERVHISPYICQVPNPYPTPYPLVPSTKPKVLYIKRPTVIYATAPFLRRSPVLIGSQRNSRPKKHATICAKVVAPLRQSWKARGKARRRAGRAVP